MKEEEEDTEAEALQAELEMLQTAVGSLEDDLGDFRKPWTDPGGAKIWSHSSFLEDLLSRRPQPESAKLRGWLDSLSKQLQVKFSQRLPMAEESNGAAQDLTVTVESQVSSKSSNRTRTVMGTDEGRENDESDGYDDPEHVQQAVHGLLQDVLQRDADLTPRSLQDSNDGHGEAGQTEEIADETKESRSQLEGDDSASVVPVAPVAEGNTGDEDLAQESTLDLRTPGAASDAAHTQLAQESTRQEELTLDLRTPGAASDAARAQLAQESTRQEESTLDLRTPGAASDAAHTQLAQESTRQEESTLDLRTPGAASDAACTQLTQESTRQEECDVDEELCQQTDRTGTAQEDGNAREALQAATESENIENVGTHIENVGTAEEVVQTSTKTKGSIGAEEQIDEEVTGKDSVAAEEEILQEAEEHNEAPRPRRHSQLEQSSSFEGIPAEALEEELRFLRLRVRTLEEEKQISAAEMQETQAALTQLSQEAAMGSSDRRRREAWLSEEREETNAQMQTLRSRFQGELEDLRGKLNAQSSELYETHFRQANTERARQELRREVVELSESRQNLQAQVAKEKSYLRHCQAELEECKGVLQKARFWNAQLQQENDRLSADLAAERALTESLRLELVDTGKRATDQHAKCCELWVSLEKERLEGQRLREALEDARRENISLKQQLQASGQTIQQQQLMQQQMQEDLQEQIQHQQQQQEQQQVQQHQHQQHVQQLQRQLQAQREQHAQQMHQQQLQQQQEHVQQFQHHFQQLAPEQHMQQQHLQKQPESLEHMRQGHSKPFAHHQAPFAVQRQRERKMQHFAQSRDENSPPRQHRESRSESREGSPNLLPRARVAPGEDLQKLPRSRGGSPPADHPSAALDWPTSPRKTSPRKKSPERVSLHSTPLQDQRVLPEPTETQRQRSPSPQAAPPSPQMQLRSSKGVADALQGWEAPEKPARVLRHGPLHQEDIERKEREISSLDKQLTVLNSEREFLKGTLLKFPPNSYGKTVAERRQKREAELRLEEVEKTIAELKQSLKAAEFAIPPV